MNHAFLLNEYYSSQYFNSGITPNTNRYQSNSRVNVYAIDDRNQNSIWINNESSEEPCKEVRIKFACEGSGVGYVYPICVLISRLSDNEMLSRCFIVAHTEGLQINGMIDHRNMDEGCVYFI